MTATDKTAAEDYDSFLSKEAIAQFPSEIVAMFENITLAILEDCEISLPWVGLRYFKNKVLPNKIAYRASYIMAQIVIQRMIAEGKLKVETIEDKAHTEFPVSVVRKA